MKEIYLQVVEDKDGMTTWCEDRINDTDVKYIKYEEYEKLLESTDFFLGLNESDILKLRNLEKQNEEMLEALIADIRFHNKYEVAYKALGEHCITCVNNSIKIVEKITGKSINEVLKDE